MLVPLAPAKAMGFDVAIHILIAMAGMYFFLKSAGGTAVGGLVGGLSYGLSSFFFLRMGHPTFIATAAWIPWMFFAYETSRTRVRTGGLLLIAFIALGYLAGMIQIFVFAIAALSIYAVADGIEAMRGGDRLGLAKRVVLLGVTGLISALLVGANLIPFIELIRNSEGPGFTYEMMRGKHLWEPVFLLRSLAPDLFGNPVEGTSWVGLIRGPGHPYNSGFHVYCGAGALMMALASLVYLRRSREIRGLLLLLVLSTGLATSAVLLKLVYAVFPPAAYSQIDRVSVIACFALAGLAGKGVSLAGAAQAGPERRRFGAMLIVLALAAIAGYVAFSLKAAGIFSGLTGEAKGLAGEPWFQRGGFRLIAWLRGDGTRWLAYEMARAGIGVLFACLSAALVAVYLGRRSRAVMLTAAALLVLALASDLMIAARRYHVTQPSDCLGRTGGIDFVAGSLSPPGRWRMAGLVYLSNVLPPNLPQVFGIPAFGGLNAITPTAHADRVAWARGSGDALGAMGTATGRLGDIMAVRVFTGDRALAEAGYAAGFRPLYEGDLYVYDNPDALPKGICVERSLLFPGGGSSEGLEIELTGHLEDLHSNLCGQAEFERYEPELVELLVQAESDCIFLFQDTYYPGWKAHVDGAPAEILPTDLGIRALELERGTHRVLMRFSPRSLHIGLILSIAGVILSIAYGLKTKNPKN
jgi:hypothetical protein